MYFCDLCKSGERIRNGTTGVQFQDYFIAIRYLYRHYDNDANLS